MGLFDGLKKIFGSANAKNIKQSRTICAKLHDSHVKYATTKDETGTDIIVGKDGHLNIVDEKFFELTFGVKSIFKFEIDKMLIWEFMSLDGAVIDGINVNSTKQETFTVYYDKHLT